MTPLGMERHSPRWHAEQLMVCPVCGKNSKHWRGRGPTYWQGLGLNHRSRVCYLKSLELDESQVSRMARQGLTRKAAAETLAIPYPTFMRKLKRQGLGALFPAIGQYSRYAS